MADHRNQNKAVGAMTLLIAGLCSSGILGIDGVCTKLKYQSRPIHITPAGDVKPAHRELPPAMLPERNAAACDGGEDDEQDNEKDHTGGDRAAKRLEDRTHSFLPFWMMGLQRKKSSTCARGML